MTTTGSLLGLDRTSPGTAGKPATAGSTTQAAAGSAPVIAAWSETTPYVRRTAAASSPVTEIRTAEAPAVVAGKVLADPGGRLASARPAKGWTPSVPRISPESSTRPVSSALPPFITSSSVRPASAPPGNVSTDGTWPRYPSAERIPPVPDTPRVAAATPQI